MLPIRKSSIDMSTMSSRRRPSLYGCVSFTDLQYSLSARSNDEQERKTTNNKSLRNIWFIFFVDFFTSTIPEISQFYTTMNTGLRSLKRPHLPPTVPCVAYCSSASMGDAIVLSAPQCLLAGILQTNPPTCLGCRRWHVQYRKSS